MTSDVVRAGTPRAEHPLPAIAVWTTAIAGCVALAARPVSDAFVPLTVLVALAGSLAPLPFATAEGRDGRFWAACVAIGIAAFAVARGMLGGSLIPPPTAWLMVSAVIAAVAEEAFFRRFLYGALLKWGVAAAIAGSSFAFAIVHITTWGWRAFPVDLAAGVLLAWQRKATGTWTAPAVTHFVANVLMLS